MLTTCRRPALARVSCLNRARCRRPCRAPGRPAPACGRSPGRAPCRECPALARARARGRSPCRAPAAALDQAHARGPAHGRARALHRARARGPRPARVPPARAPAVRMMSSGSRLDLRRALGAGWGHRSNADAGSCWHPDVGMQAPCIGCSDARRLVLSQPAGAAATKQRMAVDDGM